MATGVRLRPNHLRVAANMVSSAVDDAESDGGGFAECGWMCRPSKTGLLWYRCAALGAGWRAAMPGCKIDLPRPSLARDTAALHLLGPCSPTETSSGCRNVPPRLPSFEWFQVTPNPITCMEMDASGEDGRGPASSSLKRQIHRKLSSTFRSTVWQLASAVMYFPLGCLSHISPEQVLRRCAES